jgi:hypothetical protein
MRRWVLCLVLTLPLTAVAQPAAPIAPQKPPEPTIDAAERHFHDGVKFTEEGNDEADRVCLESGYKLSGEPHSGIA